MRTRVLLPLALSAAVLGAACSNDENNNQNPYAVRPTFLTGEPTRTDYNGADAGLVTGNAADLPSLIAYAPPFGDPTPQTLRTLQIQSSYFGLLDLSAGGGFGTYFGVLDPRANKGTEYIGVSDDGSGTHNVTLAVQVPSHFDPSKPCIVTATSSGSRGVYGEVPTVGEWALNKGCAVAYTDKGTGVGAHELNTDQAYALVGTFVPAAQRKDLVFNVNLLPDDVRTYVSGNPNRFALKHLHSKQNPEKDWGLFTLESIKLALYVLNKQFSGT